MLMQSLASKAHATMNTFNALKIAQKVILFDGTFS